MSQNLGMHVGRGQTEGARQAGIYLRHLLLLNDDYRRKWERLARSIRPRHVNRDAVAKVLMLHGQDPDDEVGYVGDPRRLKDKVHRALSGELITSRTLELFIAAFEISQRDSKTLRDLWSGSTAAVRVLVGSYAVTPTTAAAFGPAQHRTVSVHEHHYLGPDGLPSRHETRQVIEATVDGLDRYPYRFDTDALTVEVGRGCRRTIGSLYEVAPGLYGVDLELTEPLAAQATTTLEYTTTFGYRSAPAPEFRRAASKMIDGLNVLVSFHPAKLPAAVWWAHWESVDGPVIPASQREWRLDLNNCVQNYMSSIEDAVVGFRWTWE